MAYYTRKRTQYATPGAYCTILGPCAAEPNCADNCYVTTYTSLTVGYLGGDGKDVHLWTQRKDASGNWQSVGNQWYYAVSSPVQMIIGNDYPSSDTQAIRAVVQAYAAGDHSVVVGMNWIMLENCP